MPNKTRPKCPDCKTNDVPAAMAPLYRKGPRGKRMVPVPDTFHCDTHNRVARGRRHPNFLPPVA